MRAGAGAGAGKSSLDLASMVAVVMRRDRESSVVVENFYRRKKGVGRRYIRLRGLYKSLVARIQSTGDRREWVLGERGKLWLMSEVDPGLFQ
jgi:hypothetical protein